jgi:hypothetical protein
MGGEHPAVAGDNAVLFVDQYRVIESDRCHADPEERSAPPT